MIIYSIYGLVVWAKDTYEIPPSSRVLTITQEVLSLFIYNYRKLLSMSKYLDIVPYIISPISFSMMTYPNHFS